MQLPKEFKEFLFDAAIELEPFLKKYIRPLGAFLLLANEPEDYSKIEEIGLSADTVNLNLGSVLSQDPFLRRCCGNKECFARTLDLLFFNQISDCFDFFSLARSSPPNQLKPPLLNQRIEELESRLYEQGSFEKKAYFHLFNFFGRRIEDLPTPPYSGWSIEVLEWRKTAQLLGENTLSSFLSPPGTGDCFLVVKDEDGFDAETLKDWLSRRWEDAFPYCQILQYSTDAIVDIDYVVPYFNPPWVNQVQRGGIYYHGTPRQDTLPEGLGDLPPQHQTQS